MNLHVTLAKPMTKTAVHALCRLIELLKAIEHTYHRRSMLIAVTINNVQCHLAFTALSAIGVAKVCWHDDNNDLVFSTTAKLLFHLEPLMYVFNFVNKCCWKLINVGTDVDFCWYCILLSCNHVLLKRFPCCSVLLKKVLHFLIVDFSLDYFEMS